MKVQWKKHAALLAGVLLSAAVAPAQEKDPRLNPPVAPIGVESTSKATVPAAVPAQKVEKDTLSGNQYLGLENLQGSRSYLMSNLSFTSGSDFGPDGLGGTRFSSQSQFNGSLDLRREWSRNALSLTYSGGGVVYNTNSGQQNGFVQALGISETVTMRRWTLSIRNSLSFLPESGFGSSLLGSIGQNSFGSNALFNGNQLFNNGQTILTGVGKRISNSASGQLQYDVNRQFAFTASGVYGILRFLDGQAGQLESNSVGFNGGMNYKFGRGNSVAVNYAFQEAMFRGVGGQIRNQTATFSYARQLPGRMTLQIGGGPRFSHSDIVGRPIRDRFSWSATSRLLFALGETGNLGFSYSRSSTNGSGVLFGAVTDTVETTYSRQLSRKWTTSFNGGYARNESITQQIAGTGGFRFHTWHVGANAGRDLGRSLRMTMAYTYQNQDQTSCFVLAACSVGNGGGRHVINIGFQWLLRRIEFN